MATIREVLTRKRERGPTLTRYYKILRTRNSNTVIVADIFGDEVEYVSNYF